MSKQAIIDELERENAALRRNIADLKARHDKAISALAELSRSMGRDWTGRNGGWDSAMARLAGDELAAIAKMPLREGP